MFNKKTIRDIKIKNQTILVRTDYNVPMQDGKIIDNSRIVASLQTINFLLEKEAKKIILISHLGRPGGTKKPELSLKPVAKELQKLLKNHTVSFVDDVSGPEVEDAVKKMSKNSVLLLENLRFSPDEEDNSEYYAQEIVDSTHADFFVQDGFAVIHREHASTEAITHLLPSVAGLLLEKEITTLEKATKNPERPLAVIIGGAKVSDKQPLIDVFSKIADQIIVGGKIAADGFDSDNPKVYVAEDFDCDNEKAKLDIGPVSTSKIVELITPAKTIVWNGVLGKVEDPAYDTSSTILATTIGEKTSTTSVICGGDTTAFVSKIQKDHPNFHYSLISTGGGAALEFICGNSLPGLDSLEEK